MPESFLDKISHRHDGEHIVSHHDAHSHRDKIAKDESSVTYHFALMGHMNSLLAAVQSQKSGQVEMSKGTISEVFDGVSKASNAIPVIGSILSTVASGAAFVAEKISQNNSNQTYKNFREILPTLDQVAWTKFVRQLSTSAVTETKQKQIKERTTPEAIEKLAEEDFLKILEVIHKGNFFTKKRPTGIFADSEGEKIDAKVAGDLVSVFIDAIGATPRKDTNTPSATTIPNEAFDLAHQRQASLSR